MSALRPAPVVRLPAARPSTPITVAAALDVIMDVIADRVVERIVNELADRSGGARPAELVLEDRAATARRLSISPSSFDRLRRQHPDLPTVWITPEAPRWNVATVVAWLEGKS